MRMSAWSSDVCSSYLSSAYPTSNRVILPSAEITRRSLPSSTIARIGASSGICTPGMRTLRLRSVLLDTEEILQRDVDGDVASRVQADESMVFEVVEKEIGGASGGGRVCQ